MAVNDSTPVLESAENAREIALKIAEALNLLVNVQKEICEAAELVEENENDGEYVMGNLVNALGTLQLATATIRHEGEDWAGIAIARKNAKR